MLANWGWGPLNTCGSSRGSLVLVSWVMLIVGAKSQVPPLVIVTSNVLQL